MPDLDEAAVTAADATGSPEMQLEPEPIGADQLSDPFTPASETNALSPVYDPQVAASVDEDGPPPAQTPDLESADSAEDRAEEPSTIATVEAALDETEEKLEALKSQLGDEESPAPTPAEPAIEPVADAQAQPVEIDEAGPLTAEPAPTETSQATESALPESTPAPADSTPASDGQPTPPAPPADAGGDGLAPAQTAPIAEVEIQEATACVPEGHTDDKTSRARRFCRSLARGAITAPVSVLVLLDTPFCWMSPALKQVIGYAAIATALVAAGTWLVLPKLIAPAGL